MSADLLFRPATELAALVRKGELGASELVSAALERIEALEPHLNAFTAVDGEAALAAAAAIGPGDPRPFAGVPTAIKDVGAALAGWPLGSGSELFEGYTPGHNAHVARRIQDAGFVIVGKTTTPELGILPVTESRRHGATRNPWDLDRTPGGSSGGSAAAVAAGMLPLAHGSDGGGSIRTPAACCGLVGLKPSRGRISRGPDLGDSFLVSDGVLTRTVADTAAALDVLAGYEPGDATWAPPPPEPFAEIARRDPGSLRVGVTTVPPVDAPVEVSCAEAVDETAGLLASLGHRVDEASPDWDARELVDPFTDFWSVGVAMGVEFGGRVTGREPSPDGIEALTWHLHRRGCRLRAVDYGRLLVRLQSLARRVAPFFSDHDLLLTPALAQPPVRIGEIDGCGADPQAEFDKGWRFTPFTAIVNVIGQPAIALPAGEHSGGLPRGIQLVGPPAGDGLLLAVAAQLESARPWAERRPPLSAQVVSGQRPPLNR